METKEVNKRGSYAHYTEEERLQIIDDVFDDMSQGISARASCLKRGIKVSTFKMWVSKDANIELHKRYLEAKDDYIDAKHEQLNDIVENDAITMQDIKNKEMRIKYKMWELEKIGRNIFGNHVTNTHTGHDGGDIKAEVSVIRRVIIDSNTNK